MKTSLQIFLVDDDEDDHVLFEHVLNQIDEHIDCYHAYNGEAAIKMLENTERRYLPHYIFLDLNMPRMSGKECLQELKKLYNIPVIIYTTSNSDKDKEDTRQLGAQWFLVKPNSLAQLKKSLELILFDVLVPSHIFPEESGLYKL